MLEILKPVIIKPERIKTPQCCVPVSDSFHNPNWREGRYGKNGKDYRLCQRESIVQIDGKPYCKIHGGAVALDKWIKGEIK